MTKVEAFERLVAYLRNITNTPGGGSSPENMLRELVTDATKDAASDARIEEFRQR